MRNSKNKNTKPANTKAAANAATVTKGKKGTITTGTAKAVAAAVTEQANDKAALNAAFLKAAPGLRPVFQAKFKPLNLAAHKPQSASDRDNAFIHAIRTVYSEKPFTQRQTGADSGNMARAINLGLIVATGKANDAGEAFYKAVSNKAV